jgi:Ca-activated chloride channel family protein
MSTHHRRSLACAPGLLLVLAALAAAQTPVAPHHAYAPHIIVPQARAFGSAPGAAVQITSVDAGVVIVEQVATTTLDIALRNPSAQRTEAELLVPVPAGAVIRSFAFEGSAAEPTASVLAADEARRTYESIVARTRDPALLEFAGCNLIRSSVFPIAGSGAQKVRLTYEQVLGRDGARVDYELPRSASLEYKVPWKIAVRIKSKTPIATVYCPSHAIETVRTSSDVVSARTTEGAALEPGPFRLSYLLESDGVSASLLAYPDPKVGGGYFLLLAGLPAPSAEKAAATALRREVTLVLDHSGSMAGSKLEQVRTAALQIVAGLSDGEAFNIIAYNDAVTPFAPHPVLKSAETERQAGAFLKQLGANSGTNIHDALLEALRSPPTGDMLPLVLFLTDGLPTVGQTSEVAIRKVAMDHNPARRRIFTFGVGADVNTPLLQRIAAETRGTATFVLPREDVEVKVGQVFNGLKGPVVTDPVLEVLDENGQPTTTRTCDLLPARLSDLFENDQLVVLGRYTGSSPLSFVLRGAYRGTARTFRFRFDLDQATTRNAFVPRLWASRRIAVLADAIRQMGADAGRPGAASVAALAASDPRFKELTDEIVRLSTEFGILTEYTAFLAREGTDLSKRDAVLAEAGGNFQRRAMATRSGLGAMNQGVNLGAQMGQQTLNANNNFYDEHMNRVAITNVQQVNDRAFFQRGGRWVDSQVVEHENDARPQRVIEFGSDEFRALAARLAAENRQGCLALRGEILLRVGEELILVKGPPAGP